MIAAVIFDLDGVLLDTEHVWDAARRQVVEETGGAWREEATRAMMGMSSPEWSAYMRDALDVPLSAAEISREVVARMRDIYYDELPLIPGAVEAVERMWRRWPLALASSSNRELIDLALGLAWIRSMFRAVVSSEEVARGKPAPDVYLEAARRLNIEARRCAVIEDSANGIRAGEAAGMRVVAIPNRVLPPDGESLAAADLILNSLDDLTERAVEDLIPD